MESVVIHIREDAGIHRKGEPAQLGIPLPQGAFWPDQATLYLVRQSTGDSVPFEHSTTSRWPDGSVRWLLVCLLATIEAGQRDVLMLQTEAPASYRLPRPLKINTLNDGQLSVSTGTSRFLFSPGQSSWQRQAMGDVESHQIVTHSLDCKDAHGASCSIEIDSGWEVVKQGTLSATLVLEGFWLDDRDSRLARFQCQLHLYAGTDNVKLEVCLHNPNRARHPGGLWDLGDAGSIHFKSLGVTIAASEVDKGWLQPEAGRSELEISGTERLSLYQDSSGGEAWNSLNHVNASGQIIPRFKGYRLFGPGSEVSRGLRASPIAGIQGADFKVQAMLNQFWQNFPSAMTIESGQLQVGLFPAETEEAYELQGGERKTQSIWLNYSTEPGSLGWARHPLRPTLPARHYQHAGAFPWFQADADDGPLEHLIQAGLDSENNFFAKREVIDEYGWRNFGDIFADHETLYQEPGEPPLISHYNNQYDAIYGFARQFARTGDPRWFELMDDLAKHVTDVDIYHTDQDRAEYNNGLFWHTDHYLPAHTATHRTFSRHNNTSSTPGQTGGGPAAEHCYTTGLLYHYYLTGDESSRLAVLQLAGWMSATHEGQGGLLEQLLAMKKQELPKIRALIRGDSPTPFTYPFTRGTGNYLNALLDAWQLQPDHTWLDRAEKVIRHTIHPADDIDKRNLLDVETGWSYLILLTSISRYLWLKARERQLDYNYVYARDALIHYTRWMLQNEQLFLSDAKQLEFPNDTWTAQDIRKAMLLFQAAEIDSEFGNEYRQQAHSWLVEIIDRLARSNERSFTRVLIILLQNHGAYQSGATEQEQLAIQEYPSAPRLTWGTMSGRVLKRLTRALVTFRPTRERAWLNARLDRP